MGKIISKGLEHFDKKNFSLELERFSDNKTLVKPNFYLLFLNYIDRARQENDLQLKQLLCKIAKMTKNMTDFTICLKFNIIQFLLLQKTNRRNFFVTIVGLESMASILSSHFRTLKSLTLNLDM